MRQTIIFALILNLTVVALAPVLVCAFPPSSTAQTRTVTMQCDEMEMRDVQNDVSRPSIVGQTTMPCCVAGQVPRPEARYSLGKTLATIQRLDAASGVPGFIIAKKQVPAFQEQDYAPPDSQSLFCIFLV